MHLAKLGRVERLYVGGDGFHSHTGGFHRRNRSASLGVCKRADAALKDFMQSQWFVIHTLSGQEQKVKESIEKRLKTEEMGDYIKEVLVPMEKVAEVRSGKKTVTTRKLYPGYVFIDMVLLDENKRVIEKPWYFIRETQGIIGFVGGERPSPTSAEEIASI